MPVKVISLVFQKLVDKKLKMTRLYYKKSENFFLLLKTAYQKKQKFFIYPFQNPQLFLILKKLQEKSLIGSYFFRNSFEIQIFLRYDVQNLPVIRNLFLFPKNRYISLRKLKSFTNDYPFSLSLLNTKFGILDTNECQKKNCGGELIVTIS